ncbi:MAG: hypothetical protein H0Z35_13720 [Thermoanaerobacteraceae bacterium]|nr:hypothetical protein [Thermoanaerobacteraceae bacterium]
MAKVLKVDKSSNSVSWSEALTGFIYWKKAQGLSETTIRDYTCHVERFFNRFPDSWQNSYWTDPLILDSKP